MVGDGHCKVLMPSVCGNRTCRGSGRPHADEEEGAIAKKKWNYGWFMVVDPSSHRVLSVVPMDKPENMDDLIRSLLVQLGEDPSREGLRQTPERVAASLRFLTQGYSQDVEDTLNGAVFQEDCREMVLVRDIDFFSLCEHHLLPFYGKCHVAYVPAGKLIGPNSLTSGI